jgi:hypothetical protein
MELNDMGDTDLRPIPCPRCGRPRKAQRYPVCDNKECRPLGTDEIEAMVVAVRAHIVWLKAQLQEALAMERKDQ